MAKGKTSTATQEPPAEETPKEEPKAEETTSTEEEGNLTDLARSQVGGDEEVEPAAEKTEEKPAAEGDAPAEPLALTDEQIEAASTDPRVRERLMSSEETQTSIRQMLADALKVDESNKVTEAARVEQAKTITEAYQKGEEEGDWSEYGRIVAEQQRAAQQAQSLRPAVEQELRGQFTAQYDSIIEAEYGDAMNALSEEDRKALKRENFADDGAFLSGVIKMLRTKDGELVRAAAGVTVHEDTTAAANTETATRARADGDTMLGGGQAQENAGERDLADLIRSEAENAFAEVEE